MGNMTCEKETVVGKLNRKMDSGAFSGDFFDVQNRFVQDIFDALTGATGIRYAGPGSGRLVDVISGQFQTAHNYQIQFVLYAKLLLVLFDPFVDHLRRFPHRLLFLRPHQERVRAIHYINFD